MKKYIGILIVLSILVFGVSKVQAVTTTDNLNKTEIANSNPVAITRVLNVGSKGADVSALQKILKTKGFLSTNPTGYYGTLTRDAVKKYQKDANFINATGKVDANTISMIKNEQLISLNSNLSQKDISKLNDIKPLPPIKIDPSDVNTPSITILSPNGGETFTGGQSITTTWKSVKSQTNAVATLVLLDENKNLVQNLIELPRVTIPDEGSWTSTLNSSLPNGYYYVKICQMEGGCDISDNYFTIKSNTVIPNDIVPRIMYWYGKVNQHVDATGNWQTDPDGVSGANLDRLTYCKKWFPNTTSIEDYKIETIGTWMDRGNVQDQSRISAYTTPKMSTKCVSQGTITSTSPITVLSPNGGEIFTAGQQITVSWKSSNISADTLVDIFIQHYSPAGNGIDGSNYAANLTLSGVLNDGSEVVTLPSQYSGRPFGKYFKILVVKHPYDISSTVYGVSDNLFTINDVATNSSNDTTPRIMYWYGKVNQHVDAQGNWFTDSDGMSGADLNKLTYCKKFFSNTTRVEDYKLETISGWRNGGNVDGPFTSTKMSTKCVQ